MILLTNPECGDALQLSPNLHFIRENIKQSLVRPNTLIPQALFVFVKMHAGGNVQ